MKTASCKAKGRRFEHYVAQMIRDCGLDLTAKRQIGSGAFSLKGDIQSDIDFTIEVKNHEKLSVNDWIAQAKSATNKGNFYKDKWAVVFRDPKTPESAPEVYAIIDMNEFLELLLTQKKFKESNMQDAGRELRSKLYKTKQACQELLKALTT